jgi:CO/xanthine dehydrogenase FAD-binding subunit
LTCDTQKRVLLAYKQNVARHRTHLRQGAVNIEFSAMMFSRPSTLNDACVALAACQGQIISGGTDFFPALGERPTTRPLIDLSGLKELKGIVLTDDGVRIGGRVTWSEILAANLPPCFDALKQTAREVGSIQTQNVGTIAGNLCNASPAADGVPPLLAFDAQIELVSLAGRRRIPLSEFIVGNRKTLLRNDEILTAVIIPRTIEAGSSAFLKLGARRFLVISIVIVAAIVERDDAGRVAQARVAVGSCSAVAQRLPKLEQALVGMPADLGLGNQVIQAHLASLSPIDDDRASAAYRRDAALTLVRRALDACVGAR